MIRVRSTGTFTAMTKIENAVSGIEVHGISARAVRSHMTHCRMFRAPVLWTMLCQVLGEPTD